MSEFSLSLLLSNGDVIVSQKSSSGEWKEHFFGWDYNFTHYRFAKTYTEISRKMLKNVKKSEKSTEKRQCRGTPSGSQPAFACQPALGSRQNHVFFCSFFVDFSREITKKALKWTKKVKKWQHPKAGRNTQHMFQNKNILRQNVVS